MIDGASTNLKFDPYDKIIYHKDRNCFLINKENGRKVAHIYR